VCIDLFRGESNCRHSGDRSRSDFNSLGDQAFVLLLDGRDDDPRTGVTMLLQGNPFQRIHDERDGARDARSSRPLSGGCWGAVCAYEARIKRAE
jgi:hypothetical protein